MINNTISVNFEENSYCPVNVPAEAVVFQVHRLKGGINFEINNTAMKELSPKAYMLYMLLICRSTYGAWPIDLNSILSQTTLAANDLSAAFHELANRGYWTAGNIIYNGKEFNHNAFHVWESPSLNSSVSA